MLADKIVDAVTRSRKSAFTWTFLSEFENIQRIIKEDDSWRWNYTTEEAGKIWEELESGEVILGQDLGYHPELPDIGGCIGIVKESRSEPIYYSLFLIIPVKGKMARYSTLFGEGCFSRLFEDLYETFK